MEKENKIIDFENKLLLSNLKKEVSINFWINTEQIAKIIKNESLISLEKLKIELQNQNKILSKEEINILYNKLNKIKILIEETSKNEINNLKEEISKNNEIKNYKPTENNFLFSRKMINKVKNPEKPHEHLLWLSLGITNSAFTIGQTIFKIWFGILKSPYDLYLILSWKWELENLKNI